MAGLVLFGTEACHLCEEAENLLSEIGLVHDKQDIIDDEQLQQRYAVRIPVLLDTTTGMELGWPFSAEQLLNFVSQTKST